MVIGWREVGAHPVCFELSEIDLAVPTGVELRHRRVQLLLTERGAHHLDERPYLIAVERPRAVLRPTRHAAPEQALRVQRASPRRQRASNSHDCRRMANVTTLDRKGQRRYIDYCSDGSCCTHSRVAASAYTEKEKGGECMHSDDPQGGIDSRCRREGGGYCILDQAAKVTKRSPTSSICSKACWMMVFSSAICPSI